MDRIYVMQLVQSFQCGRISRRTFLQRATLALGSAVTANLLLAACGSPPAAPPSPVVDENTESDAATEPETYEGLVTERVQYPDGDGGELMGYLARPEDAENAPTVVVIQEWWGLNEHIRDVTRRFAYQGYAALAPDLYDGVVTTEPDEARKLVMELDMMEAVREIGQAISYLRDQPFTNDGNTGIVGFCMGGRLVLQTVRNNEQVGAAIAFYGTPLTSEEATEVQAPVLGLYGSEDQGIPVADVRTMETAFQEANIEHEIHIYEGAGHAFFNNTRESYAPEAAEDAWERTLAWFQTHLQTG